MDKEKHIATLKQLIQQNEKSLSEMKEAVYKLEGIRNDSVERHKVEMQGPRDDSYPPTN